MAEELHGPVERPRVRQRVSPSHIPDSCPAHADVDSSRFEHLDRQSDLQEAVSAGDIKNILELTSLYRVKAPGNLPS